MTPPQRTLGVQLGVRQLVYHVTRACSVPDIAASGALLAAKARRDPVRHGWGANEQAGHGLVCLSLAPSWQILKNRFPGQEAAILGFDAYAIGDLPGLRPCPMNSGKPSATPYVRGNVDPQRALDQVLEREAWGQAELLVPESVPLGALKLVVLSDEAAVDRWGDQIRSDLGSELSARVCIRACSRDATRQPRFPTDHEVKETRVAVRSGVDQRVVTVAAIDPSGVRDVSLDAASDELDWTDAEDEERDLFDELYGDGQRDHVLSSLPDDPDNVDDI